MRYEYDQSEDDIGERHKGDDIGSDGREALDPAEDDKPHEHDEHGPDGKRRKRCLPAERAGNGVALHHAVDNAVAEDDGDREEHGQNLCIQPAPHIVGRAAAEGGAVFILHAEDLGEHRFAEHDGHAENRRDPHPEDRAGAARGKCCCDTDQAAGTDLAADR